jgi:lipopolysaccharide export system permease protein
VRILDRYLLREFTGYLLLGLAGFIVIFVVVDVVEKVDVFLDHRAPMALILQYYVNLAPNILVKVLPVALLLATFLALGQLNKFGELTAMRAAGISLLRILVPVFGIAVASAVFSLLLGELVVPAATRQRDDIYNERIQHMTAVGQNERADVTYLGAGGRIWYTRLYVIPERRMHEVSLQEFRAGALWRRIDAAEASWENGRWVFVSGYLRTFEKGRERAERFERMAVHGIRETPDDFAKEDVKPDEMNFLELREYVTRLRASGARVANYLVDLQIKLAFPLINLIVVLIGAPVATRLRLQSAALGFGLSITISFFYYALLRTGQALGHAGVLNPYLAGWMGDLVFGAVGAVMMARGQNR